jgi:DNA-3-methyladenine glycosylase II
MWIEAEKFLEKDKYIGPLIKKYGYCQIKKRPKSKYFESLVSAIIGQQLSVKAADTIFGRLKKTVGEITPNGVLKKRNLTLRNCGLSNAKVAYVKDLARSVKSGKVEIHKMDKLDDETIINELVAVKGIGPWTAEMFLMFTLARPDIFPIDDLGLGNGFKKVIGKSLKAKKKLAFSLRWKPWRTAASWYLWSSLENVPKATE